MQQNQVMQIVFKMIILKYRKILNFVKSKKTKQPVKNCRLFLKYRN